MKYSDSTINVLAARVYKGIGRAWIVKNLTNIKSEDEIIILLKRDSKVDYAITLDDFQKKKDFIKRLLHESEGFIDGIVAVGDDDFPSHRGIVKNSEKPVFLFYRGDISLLNTSKKNVAVIGLLDPDNDTEEVEKKVVAGLVDNDVTIISGLAFGCDTVAHRQALDSKGRTVAILPSPLNKILPAKNKDLANEIVKNGGLIVTEYLTDAKSRMELGGRYQERDRLQALFSDSIILSASYAKNDLGNDSGSRLAMEYALSYLIPRSVIYDSVANKNNRKYDLNRQILEEDLEVTVINCDNMSSVIKKIISIKSKMIESQPIQKSIF